MSQTLFALGLMSGSSLDGLDLAYCRFELTEEAERPVRAWTLLWGDTLPFTQAWMARLPSLPRASSTDLLEAHAAFGHYLGEMVAGQLGRCTPEPDLIASHGHTLFHYPDRGFTFQLGDGAALAASSGLTTISDFRTQDVALGGQGAPLAPLADRHLLPGYDFYLNLGGIANISALRPDGRMVAFDIGGANQVLNRLVEPLGMPFDQGGRLAASGELDAALLKRVDALPFFQAPYPKSLGNDWVQDTLLPAYLDADIPLANKLHSACQQLAGQVARSVRRIVDREQLGPPPYRLLVTGGGAHNHFLLACMEQACQEVFPIELVVPDEKIVAFKEAALMALMGALRLAGQPNCMASVTGATRDSCAGALHRSA